MSKRELEKLASSSGAVDADTPRSKRRRETPAEDKQPPWSSPAATVAPAGGVKAEEGGGETDAARETRLNAVKEHANLLWHTVKDATSADGRTLSFDFYHLPSKRKYPDYYDTIKSPIALDQIKTRIDDRAYASLRAVKHDLETCFRNAKRYNIKGSQIFEDAKVLHKVVKRTYASISGEKEDAHEDDAGGHEGEDGEAAEPKKKTPNMHKILTKKLNKLCDKTDDNGALLCEPFMELPDKKIWAVYYKIISKPMAFDKIYKHLKRKEYKDSAAFAADVELIFDNAMSFNEDHTPIWENARTLREHFRKLMADLPPPHELPQYKPAAPIASSSNGKIRIKMPAARLAAAMGAAAAPSASAATAAKSASPALQVAKATPSSAPKAASSASPPRPSPATPAPVKTSAAATPAPAPVSTPKPAVTPAPKAANSHYPPSAYGYGASLGANPSYYPHANYAQTVVAPTAVVQTPTHAQSYTPVAAAYPPAPVATKTIVHSSSNSPAPQPPTRPLVSALLTIQPTGRYLHLSAGDKVRSWAAQLTAGEHGIRLGEVLYEPGAGSSEDDENGDGDGDVDVDDDDDDDDADDASDDDFAAPAADRRKRGRHRRRHRGIRIKDGVKLPPRQAAPDTVVRFDKKEMSPVEDGEDDEWALEVGVGAHVLELGEKGQRGWKVYITRPPAGYT